MTVPRLSWGQARRADASITSADSVQPDTPEVHATPEVHSEIAGRAQFRYVDDDARRPRARSRSLADCTQSGERIVCKIAADGDVPQTRSERAVVTVANDTASRGGIR